MKRIIILFFILIILSSNIRAETPDNEDTEDLVSIKDALSKVKSNGKFVSIDLVEEDIKVPKGVKGFIGTTRLVYNVKTVEERRALALIPTSMNVETKIDAKSGEVVSIIKPWWSFLTEIF